MPFVATSISLFPVPLMLRYFIEHSGYGCFGVILYASQLQRSAARYFGVKTSHSVITLLLILKVPVSYTRNAVSNTKTTCLFFLEEDLVT